MSAIHSFYNILQCSLRRDFRPVGEKRRCRLWQHRRRHWLVHIFAGPWSDKPRIWRVHIVFWKDTTMRNAVECQPISCLPGEITTLAGWLGNLLPNLDTDRDRPECPLPLIVPEVETLDWDWSEASWAAFVASMAKARGRRGGKSFKNPRW